LSNRLGITMQPYRHREKVAALVVVEEELLARLEQ
jgi:hypothetical protein